jgi:hypothetical protein
MGMLFFKGYLVRENKGDSFLKSIQRFNNFIKIYHSSHFL